ncbi:MAG: hypothetical protein V4850_00040 [Myxococcota bacterium]
MNRLLDQVWVLWVYPQWAPVGERWTGPGPDDFAGLARDLLATWDSVCERIRGSGEPPPYYTFSAGVRAATLRRAGLGEPLEALTHTERDCIRGLGLDVKVAAEKIAKVPAPELSDTDFTPQFTRALHSAFSRPGDDADRPRLRRDIEHCVIQHYAWVAETGVENLPLSFAAAFAAGLAEARPGLLPGTELAASVLRVLGPEGIEPGA